MLLTQMSSYEIIAAAAGDDTDASSEETLTRPSDEL